KSSSFVMREALLLRLSFQPIPAANASVIHTDASHTTGAWVPPVEGADEYAVQVAFIPPSMPWSGTHRGIDIAAPTAEVVAPGGGGVTFVGVVVDRPVISI